MQNVEQLLASKALETFAVTGTAPTFDFAHQLAWSALEQVKGTDTTDQWKLKAMQHVYAQIGNAVDFQAEFVRVPDEDEL